MKTILLLSGGNLVGQNVLNCLEGRRNNIRLIATNSRPDEPSLFAFDRIYLTPALTTHPTEFEEQFSRILHDEKPDLVIPCRDEDVCFLAEFGEKHPLYKHKLLCGPLAIAASMVDKHLSAQFCQEWQIPFADTILTTGDASDLHHFVQQFSFPLIAKPVRGFASRGVFLLVNRQQVDNFWGKKEYILQRYIGDKTQILGYLDTVSQTGLPLFHSFEQEKVSVQGSIHPSGFVSASLVTIHGMSGGKSHSVTVSKHPLWNQQSTSWIQKMADAGWRGPVNIQCQVDENGQLCAYELNGRFTGATHARLYFGFDEVGLSMQDWCNTDPGKTGWNETIHTVRKASVNVWVNEENRKTLADKKTWP